jgi:L-iditol 2-dehydrogenase
MAEGDLMIIPKTMRAAVYRGKNDIRIETLPVPRIGAHELLVKVAVCGVCPTDIKKIQYGTVEPPRVFGHETAGTIVKMGALVRGFRIGQRVALHHHVPCMDCHMCRHRAFAQCETYKRTGITAGFEAAGGGFAEYVRVMRFVLPGVVPIPLKNTFEEGAMLEPVNTVLKGVRRLALPKGDRVLVIGQGPIGLMFTRLLSLDGMRVTATDLFVERLQRAKKFGAAEVCLANDFSGSGYDAAVVTAPSNAAVIDAQTVVRGGGKVLLFAHTRRGEELALDLAKICVDEKDLIGSYSSDSSLQSEVAGLVFSRRLDVRAMVSHRFSLEETASAVDMAAVPTVETLKVCVNGFAEAGCR